MGKYDMPPELILTHFADGTIRNCKDDEAFSLNFSMQRPALPRNGGYPTEKPLSLMKEIIRQSTRPGDRILELFSGSGVCIEAAVELGRKIDGFEFSMDAILNHILPRMQKFSMNNNSSLKFKSSLF